MSVNINNSDRKGQILDGADIMSTTSKVLSYAATAAKVTAGVGLVAGMPSGVTPTILAAAGVASATAKGVELAGQAASSFVNYLSNRNEIIDPSNHNRLA